LIDYHTLVFIFIQTTLKKFQSLNKYNKEGQVMQQVYPTLDFSKIDYTKIPKGGTFIAFDSENGGLLSKIDTSGKVSPLVGDGTPGENGKNYDFYYDTVSPKGSGSAEIAVGSVWYNTANAQSYVYVFDGDNYFWLAMAQPGPSGTRGAMGPAGTADLAKKTTLEILAISSPQEGTAVYNTTIDKICIFDGSSWKQIDHRDMEL
jgi:hypothetical protein